MRRLKYRKKAHGILPSNFDKCRKPNLKWEPRNLSKGSCICCAERKTFTTNYIPERNVTLLHFVFSKTVTLQNYSAQSPHCSGLSVL